jgi:hypothetical protein
MGNFFEGVANAVTFGGYNKAKKELTRTDRTLQVTGGADTNGTTRNVVKDYTWTLSNVREFQEEIPYIELIEFKCNESTIQKQMNLYTNIAKDSADDITGSAADAKGGDLAVYADIWPKTNPTNYRYVLPYFDKTSFELSTPVWQAIDSIGDSLGEAASQASNFASQFGQTGEKVADAIDKAKGLGEFGTAAGQTALNTKYPTFGVMDRPRMFTAHNNRTITVTFPLYNTMYEQDIERNKEFIMTLMRQNLFYKRDYITGIPPVFYEVRVPGQYFCFAACITDFKAENLGNQRLLGNNIVPDAYQITITLSEMTMPSMNQFDAIQSGGNVVTSSAVNDSSPGFTAEAALDAEITIGSNNRNNSAQNSVGTNNVRMAGASPKITSTNIINDKTNFSPP